MGNKPVHIPLSIKYRPVTIDAMVLDPHYKEKLKDYYENPEKMPASILFVGTVGTGKTTIATILQRRVKKHIYIKGSVDNSINVVRERIEPFCRTSPNEKKIVRIEEADRLSNAAQLALRNIIEEYNTYPNVTFIMTANHLWKLHDALRSRSVIFYFESPPRDEIIKRLDYIIKNEGLKFLGDEDVYQKFLHMVVNKFYPRIRDMINAIESCIVGNTINPTKLTTAGDYTQKLRSYITTMNELSLKHLNDLLIHDIDFEQLYSDLLNEFIQEGNPKKVADIIRRIKMLDSIAYPEIDLIDFLHQYYTIKE